MFWIQIHYIWIRILKFVSIWIQIQAISYGDIINFEEKTVQNLCCFLLMIIYEILEKIKNSGRKINRLFLSFQGEKKTVLRAEIIYFRLRLRLWPYVGT